MRARVASFAFVVAAVAAPLVPALALAGPWTLAPGEYHTEFQLQSYSTESYRDAAGTKQPLGATVDERSIVSTTELGWKKRVSFLMSMPMLSRTLRPTGSAVTGTETGLQDFTLGLHVKLANGRSAAAIEADWITPMGYDRHLTPSLGDGQQSLGAKLDWGMGLGKRGFVQASGGYRYRFLEIGKRGTVDTLADDATAQWSDQALMSADLGLWVSHAVMIAGRYQGRTTLTNGPQAADEKVQLVGPELIYRVDDRIDVAVGSYSLASGKNTLQFDAVYVAIAFRQTKLNRTQGCRGNQQVPK
jgi:hypothetical protein